MGITLQNLTTHNTKRAIKAYIRIFKEYLSDKIPFLRYYLSESHIREQVSERLEKMKTHPKGSQCLQAGACICCGCGVPELQYADDACEGGCYGPLLSKEEWKLKQNQ